VRAGTARALLGALIAVALGACVKSEICRPGSVQLTLHFEDAALDATSVQITTRVGTDAEKSDPVPHTPQDPTLNVRIDLAAYTADADFELTVTAGGVVARVPDGTKLRAGCSAFTLTLRGSGSGDGGTDGDAASDAPVDLACGSKTHACGGRCADDEDPDTCGTSCMPCKPPPNAERATCDGVTCGFTCKDGFHRCGDACADDKSAATCGSSCQPCVAPKDGIATCDGTTCGGKCDVGQKLCAGNCIDESKECDLICAVDTHDCNGLCASNTSINSCGSSACTACATPANGTASCDGKACGASCQAGYKACPDATCVPTGGCCTPADCIPPGNAIATCTAGHVCGLSCANGFHLCGGQCVENDLPAHCGTSCTACVPPTGGAATCDGASCGGKCPADQFLCAGACIPATEPCMNMCAPDTHDCDGQCLSDASVNSCGKGCTPCAFPANGTPTCEVVNGARV
jgi:hypothetical protein